MIVATAGHVDHGKTALIKALTGTDTTHLPEERRRGMTIDLGFAGLELPNGDTLGIVDVPGHERFVRNMLAGIAGVDLVLLIVAADDGIMPQTREHLEILNLLNITEGAVVLTKIDRVDDVRLAEVAAALPALLAGTSLARAPLFATSIADDRGVRELRNHLVARALQPGTGRGGGALFRLPIDRSFIADGAGLIVTGTIASGSVSAGDRLMLMPAGKPVRVRGLHTHHRAVANLSAGNRCALNVTGHELDRSQVGRGDWMVAPEIAASTRQLDARLRPATGLTLKDGEQIQFCHGAASIRGRLVLLGREAVPAYVQVVLDEPVHALTRDVFIVRDAEGRRTLAGGIVLDPFPPNRGRRRPERMLTLAALDAADAGSALTRLLPTAPNGVDLDRFALAWNLQPAEASQVYASAALVRFEGRGYDAAAWRQSRESLVGEVERFHAENPDSFGPSTAQLIRNESARGRHEFLSAVLDSLMVDRQLVREGAQIRRPTHAIDLSPSETALWHTVGPLLGPNRRPMTMHDIARSQNIEVKTVKRLLERSSRAGHIVRISAGRFLHRSALLDLAARVEVLATASSDAFFDVAAFRDRSGLGRTISIEVLEYFDRIGFTQRVGDRRCVRRPASALFTADTFESTRAAR